MPLLARALEESEVRRELLYAMDGLGPSAAMLALLLRRRLAEVELDERLYDRAAPLLYALAAVRGGQALPEVLRVLRGAPANRRDWVREAALRTLTAFGPAASEAVPDMRRLMAAESAAVATTAARALWAAEGDRGRAARPGAVAPAGRVGCGLVRRRAGPRRDRPGGGAAARPSGPVWPRGTCGCGSAAPPPCGGCPARRRTRCRCCSRPGRRTGTRAWTSRSAWRRWARRPRARSW
ncbi:hypothetical protein O1L60_26345 [Streptomyces diastatochromogenes]|nr:hypothetical protein [Streptomyces diastatochromogenes]